MNTKTLAQLKSTITSRLHGTTLNKISDFYTLCRDTAEVVLARIDLQETRRKATMVNPVYDRVCDYALPSDFKAPVDLYKQAQGYFNDNSSLSRTFSRQFNNQKNNNQFAIVWQDMVQFIRFSRYLNTPVTVDKADSLTENGTWAVGGNASDLEVDTLNYIAGTGSLKASVSSAGAVVNVILRIGNDSSNYYHKTITTGHFEAFKTGWNLCRFDLDSATLVGTVDMENIDYVRVTVTYNTNQTAYYEKTLTNAIDLSGNYLSDGAIFLYFDFASLSSLSTIRLDNITAQLGTLFDMEYYSTLMFRTSGGTWIEQPTADTDLLNLSTVSFKIFEAEMCRIITQQIQGAMGNWDYAYWTKILDGDSNTEGLYDQYLTLYPSERIDGVTDYYNTEYVDIDFNGSPTPNGQPWSYWD